MCAQTVRRREVVRILIVEDDADLRETVANSLEKSGYRVDTFECGRAAIAGARVNEYELAIVDLVLPDMRGTSLIGSWARTGHSFPTLVITAMVDVDERMAALDAGAADYLTKPFSLTELEARIRVLLRRHLPDQPAGSICVGALVFTPGDPRILIHARPLFLPGRELALLELLAANAGRVVSTATLAKLLAGGHKPLTDTAVAIHVHRLRARLEPAGLQIRTLRGFGYLLETYDEEGPR